MRKLVLVLVAVLFVLSGTVALAQEKNRTTEKQVSEQKRERESEHYVRPAVVSQEVLKAKWAAKYRQARLKRTATVSFRVNVMPSYNSSSAYANAIVGQNLDVWGNVVGGSGSYLYKWDFGDGTTDSGAVSDPRNISVYHSYGSANTYVATLTVWDANNLTTFDTDQTTIRVFTTASQQVRVNMAIERGLKFLYLNQDPSGWWSEDVGSCIMAFEENGHYASNDFNKDIYAERVELGLQNILSNASQYSIFMQPYGNPDADGDGYGVVLNSNTYQQGLDLLGIISGGSKAWAQSTNVTGGPLAGKSIYYVVTNAIDQIAFAQTKGYGEGGWRYAINTDNYGSADNSMTAWITLSLEAAQNLWGIDMNQWPFLKPELLKWLEYSQGPDGGFGYTDPSYWENCVKTGSGIGSYAFLDSSSSSTPVANALSFLNSHWNDAYDNVGDAEQFNGNLYALWGVAKALRISDHRAGISFVGAHDWYNEYVGYLLDTYPQNSDGSFQSNIWLTWGGPLATAFGVLVLTQSVGQSLPVAVIDPTGPYPVGVGFRMNGARSFHTDPNHHIVSYEWDWDASNGLSWTNGQADATGPQPMNPGYNQAGTYRVTLRVTDDNNPPLVNTSSTDVVISDVVHHPPIAIAGPPTGYNTKVGIPIMLDGGRSYSPDSSQGVNIVSYTWDLNGDGVFGEALADTTTVVFGSAQSALVYLKVYDSRGDSSTNVAEVKVTAAQNNLVAQSLSVSPNILAGGDQVQMTATATVDPTSDISDFDNVTIRFYLGDPFTTGVQLGSDHNVLLSKGTTTTIQDIGTVPSSVRKGSNNIFVWVDALDRVPEFNKVDNLVSSPVTVIMRNVSWKIDISASLGKLVDLGSYAGVAGLATEGYDTVFDFPRPPEPPGNYISVYFSHPEWGCILGPNFFSDVKHDTDLSSSTMSWTFAVATDQASKQMTLQLTPNADFPSGYSVFLRDLKTDSVQDILANDTYVYDTGTESSRSFMLTVGGIKTETRSYAAGWSLAGFPTKAKSIPVASLITGSPYLYGYLPGGGYFAPDSVNRGFGYWLGSLSPVTSTLVGTTVLDEVMVPLNAGFNIVSLPYLDSTYSKHRLALTDGLSMVGLDSAVALGWVSPVFYFYDTGGGNYAEADTLTPWNGYWFASLQESLDLVFGATLAAPPPSLQVIAYGMKKITSASTDSSWYVGLTLQANKSSDRLGGFGVKAGAKNWFDARYDLPHPPNPPSKEYTYLVFPHPEWGTAVGPNYSVDIRSYGNPITWKLLAGYSGGSTSAVLRWDSTGVPAGVTLLLKDNGNDGTQVNMKRTGSYQFTLNGTDSLEITSVLTATLPQSQPLPTKYNLSQNYPNPFNPMTTIAYDLPNRSKVLIVLYDAIGRKVRTLVDAEKPAGSYRIVFDGSNLASGVYFYKIMTGRYTAVRKLMLAK